MAKDIGVQAETEPNAYYLNDIEHENVSNDNDKKTEHLEYEEILDVIGFGKTQWTVLFTCGLLLMMVINETMGMGIINLASQCDFNSDSSDKAILSAASFIGILVSSYFWGYLSDTKGRRYVLLYSTFCGNIFSFISMFISNFWLFVVMRFFVGIFIAGASSTTYAYLGEFFITRHRPVVINYASMFVGISMAYVPAVAWLILSMKWSISITGFLTFRPWRLLNFMNLLPGFLGALIMLYLPESPKYLLSVNKYKEALMEVNWICKFNSGLDLQDFKIFEMKHNVQEITENVLTISKSGLSAIKQMWKETRPLFKRPHLLNFSISCFVMAGLFLSSSGMGLWYPEIQNRVGASDNDHLLSVCQVIDDSIAQNNITSMECTDTITEKGYIDSIVYGLSYIAGYVVLGIIINPLGRKLVMVAALVISAACGVALYWILHPVAIVVSFVLFLMLPGLCISVLSGAVVDLVPTHLRGKAVCICLMLGRSGSVIGSNIIGGLLEMYCVLTFNVIAGATLFCALLTLVLPI